MRLATLAYLEVSIIFIFSLGLVDGLKDVPCGGLDIRSFKQLDQLDNCTVILGNLTLIFPLFRIDDYEPSEINNRSFPLREITDFLIIVYVNHLESLGSMFPNLSVIRGRRLYGSYAVCIGETDLKEITLRNLQIIGRGSVGISGNNPRLCLPTKYDWDHVIKDGALRLHTPRLETNCDWMRSDRCDSCPGDHGKCWHNGVCQRFEKFYAKVNKKFDCHRLCVAGCSNPTSSGCFTCLDIKNDDECVDKCPENKLLHDNFRRCIEKSECAKHGWKIFQDRCVRECPMNFTSTRTAKQEIDGTAEFDTCVPCVKCPRTCFPGSIRRIDDLEMMGIGCTIIGNDLDINLVENIPHVMDEVMEYLGKVETIHGSLQIHRSPVITNLNFLKNLRLIRGHSSNRVSGNMSILIYENRNLQKFFDVSTMGQEKIVVQSGNVRIFNNLLLCPKEVQEFLSKLERKKGPYDWIRTNGKLSHCMEATIETKYSFIDKKTVIIRWKDKNPEKHEYYSGFNIRYVPVEPSHTMDHVFSLRTMDSCSLFGWEHKYVAKSELNETDDGYFETTITGLQPKQMYEFAVETYHYSVDDPSIQKRLNLDPDLDGASSKPQRFSTEIDIPSRVKKFYVSEVNTSWIKLDWAILEYEVPAIQFFYIDVVHQPFNVTHIGLRNYCRWPTEAYEMLAEGYSLKGVGLDDEIPCCQLCCLSPRQRKGLILPDYLLVKEISELSEIGHENTGLSNRKRTSRHKFDNKVRSAIIEDLRPFSQYKFYIHVCASNTKCSGYELVTAFTDINATLENLQIDSYFVEDEALQVKFQEPASNGPIVSYNVEIQSFNGGLLSSQCITRKEHAANHFVFKTSRLEVGIYTFRVKANSIARDGNYTELFEFTVPTMITMNEPFELALFVSFIGLGISIYVSGYTLDMIKKDPEALRCPDCWYRLMKWWTNLRRRWRRRIVPIAEDDDVLAFINHDQNAANAQDDEGTLELVNVLLTERPRWVKFDAPGPFRNDAPGPSRNDAPGPSRNDAPRRSRSDAPGPSRKDAPVSSQLLLLEKF